MLGNFDSCDMKRSREAMDEFSGRAVRAFCYLERLSKWLLGTRGDSSGAALADTHLTVLLGLSSTVYVALTYSDESRRTRPSNTIPNRIFILGHGWRGIFFRWCAVSGQTRSLSLLSVNSCSGIKRVPYNWAVKLDSARTGHQKCTLRGGGGGGVCVQTIVCY